MGASPELMTGLGAAAAMFLSAVGSCHGSVHGGIYAVRQAKFHFLHFVPVIIAGVLSIYGIIVSVILASKLTTADNAMTEMDGYRYLSAGLVLGLSCLVSGVGIGKFMELQQHVSVPPSTNGATPQETDPLLPAQGKKADVAKTFLVLVFLEAIGLYGLIVALILSYN